MYARARLVDGKYISNYYTKSEADDRFVNVAGDTMTGALTVKQYIFGYNYNYAKELHNKMLFNEIFPLTNEATRMYYLEGMKQVDIAKILGVSQKKVSFLIKKNIQNIRKYCDENNLEYYY